MWQKGNAKYAVALYGIDQDTAKMGGGTYTHTMTFGPATGGVYVTRSKAAHIAASSLKGGGWKDDYLSKETGDGPSVLYNELHDEFRVWQPGTGSGTFQFGDNTGGYPASRIRAVLNGYDWTSDSSHGNTTDLTRANQKYAYTRSDESVSNTGWDSGWDWRLADLTDISTVMSDNCLLSCFPENLRAAIVPKAVKSDTVYNDTTGNNVTTWDKLWLFSGKEMYVDSGEHNKVIRPNEGTIYDRITKQGITTSKYTGNKGYYRDGSYGTVGHWWLRSARRDGRGTAYSVYGSGNWDWDDTGNGFHVVAPGFVIGE